MADLDALIEEYETWLAQHPHIPKLSADDVLASETQPPMTREERHWLQDFCVRWEEETDNDRIEGTLHLPKHNRRMTDALSSEDND